MQKQQKIFCRLCDIRHEIDRWQAFGKTVQKYVPPPMEIDGFRRYAEGFDYPGVVVLRRGDVFDLVCSSVYTYRNNEMQEIFTVFNAEVMYGDVENGLPEFTLSLTLGPHYDVSVPIRHAYCRHIFWQDEFLDISGYIDIAEEQINNFMEYLDEHGDDDDFYDDDDDDANDDDDDSYVYHQ